MKIENKSVALTVVVAALGYFVDIYDLLLFGIVRVPSLRAIGVSENDLLKVGIQLINAQMAGLLCGGILWGIWGDKKGRLSVLFGSIFLYSLTNIANAFVTSPDAYALLRFLAGVGLAGELGAAITLVSEMMTKENRGIGTAIVASVGILGAVFASFVGDLFDWKTAYIVGGTMGLALLLLRIKMFESGLYSQLKSSSVVRGDFLMLFRSSTRFWKYLRCIFIGIPIWFVIGILITFSPELARELGVTDPIRASTAIMMSYIGLSVGDLLSGLLSQKLRSRKKVVALFMGLTVVGVILYTQSQAWSGFAFYCLCTYLGFSVGYWAVFITIGAEQFGTNLRATVATTVPNFVRGAVVPLSLSFQYLKTTGFSLVQSASFIGFICLIFGFISLIRMSETFGKDLNYLEIESEKN